MAPNLYPGRMPAQLADLPGDSVEQTRATLKRMCQLVRQFKTDTGIRALAQELTRPLASKAFSDELRTLQNFVRDRVRYVRDVRNVETLQTPVRTLEAGSGDCDDKATLLAALLESIGFNTRFRAVGLHGDTYSHVLAEGYDPTKRKWVPLECIVPGAEPGWFPSDVTRSMFAHV
jgi:transglutaminase-like putative cysteine protease